MKKTTIEKTPGDIIKIPLPDGTHTYARILIDESYAFYDCKTAEEISDINAILQSPILFCAMVDIFGIKEGRWTIIGNKPLEGKLENFYPRYFEPAPTNSANVGFYEVYMDEIEEAIKNDWIGDGKLQMGGMNSRVHIEERIMNYYQGKRDEGNRNVMWVFKKLLGLPLDNL
jgi:hypothetical protein